MSQPQHISRILPDAMAEIRARTKQPTTYPLFNLPLSPRLGAVSSFKAAEAHQASGNWTGQARAVLKALKALGGSVTSMELAHHMGVDRHLTARKLPDLRRQGFVENGPTRKCRILHKPCLTWQTTDKEA